MLQFHHYDRSTAAQKIRIALAEKGLEKRVKFAAETFPTLKSLWEAAG